jgi:phage tail-like protein
VDKRTIVITLQTSEGEPLATCTFHGAWPVELSELDAGKNEVTTETIEIAHEGFEME